MIPIWKFYINTVGVCVLLYIYSKNDWMLVKESSELSRN